MLYQILHQAHLKSGDHDNISQPLVYYSLLCRRAHINDLEMAFNWESGHKCLYTLEGMRNYKILMVFGFVWYGFLTSFKGPQNFMVMASGYGVDWPLL